MEYECRVLIVDGPEGDLQSLAMKFLGLDYSVHYANDLSEAQLLAREEREHLRAVLLSSSIDPSQIPELARRFGRAPSSFVPIGMRPEKGVVERLARDGVRWHLWDAPSEQAVRGVVSAVLSEHDPYELRLDLRIPIALSGQIQLGDQKADVVFRDISVGGACIVGQTLLSKDDAGLAILEIEDDRLELPIEIAWSKGETSDGVHVAGLTFTEVDPEAGRIIEELIDNLLGGQRIKPPQTPSA